MRPHRIWLVVPLLLLLQLHVAAAAPSPDRDPDVSTSQTGAWLPQRAGTRMDLNPDPNPDPPLTPPPPRGYGAFDCDGIAWADCDDALRPILKAVYECEPGYGFHAWPDKGYSAKDDAKGLCLPCRSGFYSPGGYAACRPCGTPNNGFTTPNGASKAEQCFCKPGFGGVGCLRCPQGTYSPGGTSQDPRASCLPCPPNNKLELAMPGAVSPQQCGGCIPGFGGPNCQPCPANTYSSGGNYMPCTPCGAHQSSPPMSSSKGYCDCVAGYGYNGVECILCPLNSFWPGPASLDTHDSMRAVRADPLPAEPSACIRCANNPENADATTTLAMGSTSSAQCVCNPGYGGPNCQVCPAGSWSRGGSLEPCTTCSNGAIAPLGSISPAACGCEPGRGGPTCAVCPKDTYGLGGLDATGANQVCTPCSNDPNEITLNTGAKSAAECVCNVGFAGPFCTQCTADQICPGGSKDPPTRCPANSVALPPPGTFTTRDCLCKPGFGRPAGSSTECEDCPLCEQCRAGFYNDNGRESCKACPRGHTSNVGSDGLNDCYSCPDGSYLDGGVCVACPAGSTTAVGGPHVGKESCNLCLPGFGLQPCLNSTIGGCLSCQPCPAGTYQTSSTSQATCKSCPVGQTSPPGSTTNACDVCPQGTYLEEDECKDCPIAPLDGLFPPTCGCPPGRGDPTCRICPLNSYGQGGLEANGGNRPCIQCPANQMTLDTGADSVADCVCKPGFAGPDCSACTTGQVCPGGSKDPPGWCPANSGPSIGVFVLSIDDCVCNGGYGRPAASAAECKDCPLCELCPAGFWNDNGRQTCKPCPTGTTSAPGSINAGNACGPCPDGTYLEGSECVTCPLGSTTAVGGNHVGKESCSFCVAGFGLQPCLNSPDGSCSSCQPCPAGTYQEAPALGATCQPCNSGQTSPIGSTAVGDCSSCPPNSYAEDGICQKCPAGSYTGPGSGAGRASCRLCGPGFGLQPCPGSTDGSCLYCQACPSGTYQEQTAEAACKSCPEGTTSNAGSSAAGQCLCKPGYGLTGNKCLLCPIGQYSAGNNGATSSTCGSCPAGMTTLQLGSSSSTDCVCKVGYGSSLAAPTTCDACLFPKYQGHLDINAMPVTSATIENPYPLCQQCKTGGTDPGVVGNAVKACLSANQDGGAYCVSVTMPGPGGVPPCL